MSERSHYLGDCPACKTEIYGLYRIWKHKWGMNKKATKYFGTNKWFCNKKCQKLYYDGNPEELKMVLNSIWQMTYKYRSTGLSEEEFSEKYR